MKYWTRKINELMNSFTLEDTKDTIRPAKSSNWLLSLPLWLEGLVNRKQNIYPLLKYSGLSLFLFWTKINSWNTLKQPVLFQITYKTKILRKLSMLDWSLCRCTPKSLIFYFFPYLFFFFIKTGTFWFVYIHWTISQTICKY